MAVLSIRPDISIIIPVLNEGQGINRTLAALPEDPGITGEVIVVDGDPRGSTIRTVTAPTVRAIVGPRGRASQMNAGAAQARGLTLLFLHADTELPEQGLSAIAHAMRDETVVAGAFDLAINSPRQVFRFIERIASFRSRLTRIPFGDQALFVRAGYFRDIGGFRDIPIMEDAELMARIRKRGDTIRILRLRVLTSPRRWEKEGVLRCTLRNWLVQILYCCGVSPGRLARFYRAHGDRR